MKKPLELLLVLVLCLFVSGNSTVKASSPPVAGILIASGFLFNIQGDGITTQFTITPSAIPQVSPTSGPDVPKLALLGMSGTGQCGGGSIVFTGKLVGSALGVIFTAPPPNGVQMSCGATLLFRPS